MNNYYLYKHSFHNALITNDSLIKYAWMTSQSNVPGLLDRPSRPAGAHRHRPCSPVRSGRPFPAGCGRQR